MSSWLRACALAGWLVAGSLLVWYLSAAAGLQSSLGRPGAPSSLRQQPGAASAAELPGAASSSAGRTAAAPPLRAAKPNRRCESKDPKIDAVIARILCSDFSAQQWRRCALVGGAQDLNGKGMGPEINAHDTVIRVNRVPTATYFHDFGNRTDVLFAGPRAENRGMYSMFGQFAVLMGGGYSLCDFEAGAGECPFKALVLKGADFPDFHQAWGARYPVENPGWRPNHTNWPLGYQVEAVNSFAYDLLDGSRPTNGFHAFLTFLLVCDELDVYGFSGARSADGHAVSAIHNLGGEHKMLSMLASGEVPYQNKHGKTLKKTLVDRLRSRKGHVRIVQVGG